MTIQRFDHIEEGTFFGHGNDVYQRVPEYQSPNGDANAVNLTTGTPVWFNAVPVDVLQEPGSLLDKE